MNNCQSRKSSKKLPKVWLMSDPRFGDRLYRCVQKLPKGSGVIMRNYDDHNRPDIFKHLSHICRRRGLVLIVAGNEKFRGGQGHYYGKPPKTLPLGNPYAIKIISIHNVRELAQARKQKADQILISPLYATNSHIGVRPLGIMSFRRLALISKIPVIALGGMDARRNAMIRYSHGYAAIDGLLS